MQTRQIRGSYPSRRLQDSVRTAGVFRGTVGRLRGEAFGINDLGEVVGWSTSVNRSGYYVQHAFIHSGATFQDLNTLIPPGSGWVLSDATGINDSGQIVCDGYNTGGEHHAFLFNKQ
jgi:probable HAF family extracellular repeat protein